MIEAHVAGSWRVNREHTNYVVSEWEYACHTWPGTSVTPICIVSVEEGSIEGLLETEKPSKNSPKTAKPQEISSKTENHNESLH